MWISLSTVFFIYPVVLEAVMEIELAMSYFMQAVWYGESILCACVCIG